MAATVLRAGAFRRSATKAVSSGRRSFGRKATRPWPVWSAGVSISRPGICRTAGRVAASAATTSSWQESRASPTCGFFTA